MSAAAMAVPPRLSIFSFIFFIAFVFSASFLQSMAENGDLDKQKHKVYVVHIDGDHGGGGGGSESVEDILKNHRDILVNVKNSKEEARSSLVYSYKSFNSFAALLTEDEATKLSEMEGVASVSRSVSGTVHTTRSWNFLGEQEGLPRRQREVMTRRAKHGKDVIVGVIDTGIWPESRSFSDRGMEPVPRHWKGFCQEGVAFNSSNCNRKIIGARYYLKAYEHTYGPLNESWSYRSPRDHMGHGSHTASTIAGRRVRRAAIYGRFAAGTATGGAPLARLAIYKVLWPVPGPDPNAESTCETADVLAAIDDAILDGVDVISLSLGANNATVSFVGDGIAVGALHAVRKNVVVVASAGNNGPDAGTLRNVAPWMATVAASSIDRNFYAPLTLGNGALFKGPTLTPFETKRRFYPLAYAGDVEVAGTPSNISGMCLQNTLSTRRARGKIVLCMRGVGLRLEKGKEVKRAGGAAMILGNNRTEGIDVPGDAHYLPATAVTFADAESIRRYIDGARRPTARLGAARTVLDERPAPVMANFSSRGPNTMEPNLLKPDITAPGVDILAAWSGAVSPTGLDEDRRRVSYNLLSGTSMSCPHVSATAALLRAIYPHWSSAAIRSAIMTTAATLDNRGKPIETMVAGEAAGPFEYGAGHLRPVHASDPGLVYDATYEDYLLFACANSGGVSLDHRRRCPRDPPRPYQLNYPSIAVAGLRGAVTVTRTVTNVGRAGACYSVNVEEPTGVSVDIRPSTLSFSEVGEKKSFNVTMAVNGRSKKGQYAAGSYTWHDGIHVVRSPMVVLVA